MKPQRIPSPPGAPTLDLSANPAPLLNPKSLSELQLHAPMEISPFINDMPWDKFFDLSCSIANQHRALGATGAQGSAEDASIWVNSQLQLSTSAAAHAWIMALAQRASMEIRQMEHEPGNRAAMLRSTGELAGVAFLASVQEKRGTGRRLQEAMQKLAMECTVALGSEASVEFAHRRPVQMVSPVQANSVIPFTAYRVRFRGCKLSEVRRTMAHLMQNRILTECSGDQLILSQS